MSTSLTTLEAMEEQEMYELWNTTDELFPTEDGESISATALRLGRQNWRRLFNGKNADTLKENQRHHAEKTSSRRQREAALLRIISLYTDGGYEADII